MSLVLLSTLSLCPGSFSPGFLQLDHDSMLPALRNLPSLPDGIRYLPRHHTVSHRSSFAMVFGYSSTQKAWIRQRRPCPCSGPFLLFPVSQGKSRSLQWSVYSGCSAPAPDPIPYIHPSSTVCPVISRTRLHGSAFSLALFPQHRCFSHAIITCSLSIFRPP